MPGAGKRPRAGTLQKAVSQPKRRRTSNVTKVRFQRPTAKNQRRQIMSNARRLNTLSRIVYQSRVYCDWQAFDTMFANWDTGGNYSKTWGAWALSDFPSWNAVLRKDDNVLESSSTFLKRLQINFRYYLDAASYAQFNIFVVTLRKDAAAYNPVTNIAGGVFPVDGTDYVAGPSDFNIRLNPAKFKVHFARQITLTENTLLQDPLQARSAGNPYSTWKKGQFTMPVNSTYRVPAGTGNTWRNIPYTSQPYYQRYFLLALCVSGNAATAATGQAKFQWDSLATTINYT